MICSQGFNDIPQLLIGEETSWSEIDIAFEIVGDLVAKLKRFTLLIVQTVQIERYKLAPMSNYDLQFGQLVE